jgi:hypothetical protein
MALLVGGFREEHDLLIGLSTYSDVWRFTLFVKNFLLHNAKKIFI